MHGKNAKLKNSLIASFSVINFVIKFAMKAAQKVSNLFKWLDFAMWCEALSPDTGRPKNTS